ncbi:hypothetical protein [Glycomyces xiaoerkulensis]|uniref:hypothetical protein n=1 Tax=Glycomyces xiaoerkulensis TaxID=2038139 RepID=UPI001300084C|nr:hypothetical protein [Glycomyces xiaoerkulensis]
MLAGRSKQPVLAGEAKWGMDVSAPRLFRKLEAKAASLVDDTDDLQYAIAAWRSVAEVLPRVGTLTAGDLFG